MNAANLIEIKDISKSFPGVQALKDVSFSVDEESESTVIKVFRTNTGELIKQFPSEEILAMKARIRNNTSWFFDSKV